MVDLVVVDADVKQQTAAVLEVLLAVSAGVGGVQQVLVVLLQQAHEVGAVVVLQQDHCNKIIFSVKKNICRLQKIFHTCGEGFVALADLALISLCLDTLHFAHGSYRHRGFRR